MLAMIVICRKIARVHSFRAQGFPGIFLVKSDPEAIMLPPKGLKGIKMRQVTAGRTDQTYLHKTYPLCFLGTLPVVPWPTQTKGLPYSVEQRKANLTLGSSLIIAENFPFCKVYFHFAPSSRKSSRFCQNCMLFPLIQGPALIFPAPASRFWKHSCG